MREMFPRWKGKEKSFKVSRFQSLNDIGLETSLAMNYRIVFSNPRMSLKEGKGRKPMGLLSEGLRNKV